MKKVIYLKNCIYFLLIKIAFIFTMVCEPGVVRVHSRNAFWSHYSNKLDINKTSSVTYLLNCILEFWELYRIVTPKMFKMWNMNTVFHFDFLIMYFMRYYYPIKYYYHGMSVLVVLICCWIPIVLFCYVLFPNNILIGEGGEQ